MNIEQFLTTGTGKRLMKIAEREQQEFNTKLNGMKAQLEQDKQDLHALQFGLMQNARKVMVLDGNPVLVSTNNSSYVTKVENITPDIFNELSPQDMQSIRNISNVTFQRLKAGTFKLNDSDKYYELVDKAESGIDGTVLEALAHAPQNMHADKPNYVDDAWNYYDSSADRVNQFPKYARHIEAARSEQNILKASMDIMDLEKAIEQSIESNEIVYFDANAQESGDLHE
ncbi:hypothetical protein RE438_22800 [Bacillus wiedmannii]|uniref:hypothetical protein n=1 Tax=Bacillus wiedmannii TaxID=1890302 RepID=UPI00065C1850|nr:hypothetical protein [Bacillus wiedmannii]KMP73855.1 hypothetical protein TU62_19065 [Bacillus cereus]MCQ6541669.1 hypothetical protein [Bacillus wiedmannii]MCQ6571489.1 hypothetical protein [Bacillus wiedmannii]WMS81270.1 hypothetical protein RE438_22800 [Bacillus wiedmannii]HDR7672447.1 hypothetical protein [Bacillus wiedmannii]